MIQTKTTMRMEHFHDFYILEALKAETANELSRNPDKQFSHSVTKLQFDLAETIEYIVPNIAFRTFVYLYAACLGESRHARNTNAGRYYIPETREKHRNQLFSTISNYSPTPANLKALIRVFEQDWSSGFGGSAWAQIAKALPMYFTMPNGAWLDYVVDLEHNNGTAFNKEDAKNTIFFSTEYSGEKFSHFLDYKFAKNILFERWYGMNLAVSNRVYKLVRRFCNLFSLPFPTWIYPELKNLTDYTVAWLDGKIEIEEKWYEWADVTKENRPSVSVLETLTELDNIYAPHFTKTEWEKAIKKADKQAKKIAKAYWTKELAAEWKKKIETTRDWGFKSCKPDKCKTTYNLLPIIGKVEGHILILEAQVPYESVGTKTENGVEFRLDMWTQYFNPNSMTFGGYENGHISYEYGTMMLYLDGKILSLHSKELEAILS